MAFLIFVFSSYSLVVSIGHFWAQLPQPVRFFESTRNACCFTVTLKLPASPSTVAISAFVMRPMLWCLPVATSFGAMMHIAQSFVGKVLSSWAIVPPMLACFSTRYTLYPESAMSRADCNPEMPPPTTRTEPRLWLCDITAHLLPRSYFRWV